MSVSAGDSDRHKMIVYEVREFCMANADEETTKKYARYFREGYDAYGLDNEKMDALEGQLLEKYGAGLSLDDVIALGNLLIVSGKYEEASVAIRLARRFNKQYTPEAFEGIGGWLESGICNWGHTDSLSSDPLSFFILKGIVSPDALRPWVASLSRWKRRAVPVTLIPLAKKGENIPELLDIVRPLMADQERVVHQGVGWFLREAWKKSPGIVEAFLMEYKDSSPRLIFQYATEKMMPEAKARFKSAQRTTRNKK